VSGKDYLDEDLAEETCFDIWLYFDVVCLFIVVANVTITHSYACVRIV